MPNLTIQSFKGTLNDLTQRGELALPSTVDPQAFQNAAVIAVQSNPAILNCAPESVFTSVRHLAGMGLVPDNREAAIVPFKGKAQAMPMVYGVIKAAKRSGQVVSLFADVVYEGEEIQLWIEDGERKFDHTQEGGGRINPMKRGGKVVGAYSVAKLKDGTVEFEPMGLEQIEKRRKASPTQKGDKPTGVWGDWYEEMAKKTVIHSIAKRLPMSREDMNAIEDDPTLREVTMRDVTPPETTEERLERIRRERAEQSNDEQPGDESLLEYDATLASPMDHEFDEGVGAFKAGKDLADNPYDANPAFSSWHGGFLQAKEFADQEDGQ